MDVRQLKNAVALRSNINAVEIRSSTALESSGIDTTFNTAIKTSILRSGIVTLRGIFFGKCVPGFQRNVGIFPELDADDFRWITLQKSSSVSRICVDNVNILLLFTVWNNSGGEVQRTVDGNLNVI